MIAVTTWADIEAFHAKLEARKTGFNKTTSAVSPAKTDEPPKLKLKMEWERSMNLHEKTSESQSVLKILNVQLYMYGVDRK